MLRRLKGVFFTLFLNMATSDGSLNTGPGAKLTDLLKAAREYEPLIPSVVVDYYLKKSGCIIDDNVLLRIVALAAQQLACDIVSETSARAMGRSKRRRINSDSHNEDDTKPKRKMETKDLEGSLLTKGIISDVPPCYYAETSKR